MKSQEWGDKVTIVFGDMRKWKSPEKVRPLNFIIVLVLINIVPFNIYYNF